MHRLLILVLCAAVSGCADGDSAARQPDPDPVTIAALADPLMTDPDLVSQSHASAALGGGGPTQAEIPRESNDPRLVNAIRAEAEKLAGGRLVAEAPRAERPALPEALTPPVFAALMPGAAACAQSAGFGFVWAAALPEAFPIYPRGHALVAAGNNLAGCRLRAVRFTSPIPEQEIAAFYLARGKAAGLALDYRQAGNDLVLTGRKGASSVMVRIRTAPDRISVVDLATIGI